MKPTKFLAALAVGFFINLISVNAQTWNIPPAGVGGTNLGYLGTTSLHPFALRAGGFDRMLISSTGDIGINTSTPLSGLHVRKNASYGTNVWIDATNTTGGGNWVLQSTGGDNPTGQGNLLIAKAGGAVGMLIGTTGNIGIGQNLPATLYPGLHVKQNASYGTNIWIDASNTSGGGNWAIQSTGGDNGTGPGNLLFVKEGGAHTMTMTSAGRVGIGTTNFVGDYKLYVATGILTEKVKVASIANWPDFVFDKNYKLRSLSEVESFIKKNNHLPEIPSQEDVKANGADLVEMDAKLLMKVEELTLYMIELKKENELLKQEIKEIKKKNDELFNKLK